MPILTLEEYRESQEVSAQGYSFYALLAALFRDADTDNLAKLKRAWPDIWDSFQRRFGASYGVVAELDGLTPQEYHDRSRAGG